MFEQKTKLLGVALVVLVLCAGLVYAATTTPPVPEGRVGARAAVAATIAIHGTVGSADTLDMRNYTAGQIKIPASVTAIAFYGCDTASGTFTAVHESSNVASTIGTLTAGDWYNFPPAACTVAFLRIVSTGANGTATVVLKT